MTRPKRFAAKVDDAAALHVAEPLAWRAALQRLRGQVVYVQIESLRQIRSGAQNRRYWGLVVPLVAEVLSENREVPLSSEQAHEVCKYAFLGRDRTALGPVPRSTRGLNTADFAAYCERIEHWLLHSHGVVVPAAGETLEDTVA